MNYIQHLNAYRLRRLQNPLSTNAIALYSILLEYGNMIGWPERFTVANTMLQGLSGLSRNALHVTRNELVQKGYITYKKGTGNQCGTYLIVCFNTQTDTQYDTQTDTQTQHSPGTLYKPNQTKPKDIPSSAEPPIEKFTDNSDEMKLCLLLADRMRRNKPDCKLPSDFQGWCKHVDLMIRIDGRTPKQIQDVILFCQKDAFWQSNILSTKKLREKFDQLSLKMQSGTQQQSQEKAKSFSELIAERMGT